MEDQIAVFSGSKSLFNVLHDVRNMGWMLTDSFELDLVTTKPNEFGSHVTDYFTIRSYGHSGRFDEFQTLRSYLQAERPRAVVTVVEQPLHSTSVASLLKRHDVPFTYRYASDLFNMYRVERSWKKPARFALNNGLSQVPVRMADNCIALGPTGKKRLMDRGKDASDVPILPPPVDEDRFTEDHDPPEWDVPDDRSVALFAGRRTRIKGMGDMDIAIPEIVGRRDDMQFAFVGSHGREPDVPPEYEEHVTMVGRVPLGEMPRYFQAADLLVLPSYHEGLPRVVLEALATGIPVVARDIADVAYATDNTFTDIQQFIDMVVEFESLPVDDVTPFTRTSLKDDYVNAFQQF